MNKGRRMTCDETHDMAGMRLPKTLKFGCIELRGADKLPLAKIILDADSRRASVTFWGRTRAPWNDLSLVNVMMFRLPKDRAEFTDCIAFFSEERKQRTRLPEGTAFEPTHLALLKCPPDWQHDGFARGQREIIHVYHSKQIGLLLRFWSRAGTMLNHPLLSRVHSGLRVVADAWVAKPPKITCKKPLTLRANVKPLSAPLKAEVKESAAEARQYLGVKQKSSPAETHAAIHAGIEAILRTKAKPQDAEVNALAINLGCLWGETLCEELDVAGCPAGENHISCRVQSESRLCRGPYSLGACGPRVARQNG